MILLHLFLLILTTLSGAFGDTIPLCDPSKPLPKGPGEELPLVEFHKNINPQNVAIIHTYVDSKCLFAGSDEADLINVYWLMNSNSSRHCLKPTHQRIKQKLFDNIDVEELAADKRHLRLRVKVPDHLKLERKFARLTTTLKFVHGKCQAQTSIQQNGEGKNAFFLEKLFSVSKTRFGLPIGIEKITLQGYSISAKGKTWISDTF